MEHVKKAEQELEKLAHHNPQFIEICKKYGLPPGKVLGGVFGVVILFGVISQGYNIICSLLTCIYPLIQSIRSIESGNGDDDKKWLCFWTVFGIFQTVELFIGFLLEFIPYYYWLRVGFFVYLMAPQTQGSEVLYKSVFKPFLTKHRREIEKFIDSVKTQADAASKEALSKAKETANDMANAENMMKAMNAANQVKEKLNEAEEKVAN